MLLENFLFNERVVLSYVYLLFNSNGTNVHICKYFTVSIEKDMKGDEIYLLHILLQGDSLYNTQRFGFYF